MNPVRHRDVLAFLWHYTRPYARSLALMAILSMASTACFLWSPFFYRTGIAAIAAAPDPNATTLHIAIVQFLQGIGIAALAFILEQVSNNLLGRVELRAMRQAYRDVLATVQRHSMGFHVNEFAGSTARKISRGIDAFESVLDKVFLNFLPIVILLVGFITVLSFFAPLIGGAIFIGILFYSILSWKLNVRLARAYSAADAQDTRTTGNLVDVITGNPLVKSFAAEAREDARHDTFLAGWQRLWWAAWLRGAGVTLVQFFFLLGIELVVYLLAIWLWYRGRFSSSDFIVLIFYMMQLWGRMWDFGRNVRDYLKEVSHAQEMVQVASEPPEVKDAIDAEPLTVTQGAVLFTQVRFSYEGQSQTVFKQLSVTIQSGERVALVGHSGGGKSTFVKLLLRLYDVQGGQITVDNQDIAKVTQESLRSSIALVPQDPILFHRSIRQNISYGKPDASEAQIEQAARAAHAHEFIVGLPQGYDAHVGERGVKLSGGERQRIAIARALLADRPILILDEATSSLDSLSEKYIQEALERLMEGRTSIVIAHRLSTIKRADRILVIEHGAIVEEGTHEVLLEKPRGLYRRLYELQAGGFIGE